MGKHQRAHYEKLKAREQTKKRALGAGLALGLSATALLGYNQLSGETKEKPAPQEIEAVSHDAMPADLAKLLKQVATPQSPVDRLIEKGGKQLDSFSIGANNVRVIQAGGELSTGKIDQSQLKSIRENYEVFNTFANSGATVEMPVFEATEDMAIKSARTLQLTAEPVNKDIVLFVVPTSFDIGTWEGAPQTFTDTRHDTIVSFVRPDYPNGGEGVMVEACQATVNAKITNPEEFADVDSEKLKRLTLLGQENLCNSLAKGTHKAKNDIPHDEYREIHSRQVMGGTNKPTATDTGYFGTMPYIGDEQVYSSLVNGIPTNIGDSFIYPPVS